VAPRIDPGPKLTALEAIETGPARAGAPVAADCHDRSGRSTGTSIDRERLGR